MGAFIDFTGKKFGSLTVVSFSRISDKKRTYWNCVCDCGVEKEIWAGSLRNTKSCGKKDCMPLLSCNVNVDLSGKTFSYLNVIKYELRKHWLCQCICGNFTYVKTNDLLIDKVKSCGCKSAELNAISHILPNNQAFFNKLYSIYKRGAKDRNYLFDLSIEQLQELVVDNCFYCGSPPTNSKFKRKFLSGFKYNGIDRINNGTGYTIENVVSCCALCNMAKRDMSYDDFLLWLDRIVSFRGKKNAA